MKKDGRGRGWRSLERGRCGLFLRGGMVMYLSKPYFSRSGALLLWSNEKDAVEALWHSWAKEHVESSANLTKKERQGTR